MSDQVFSVSTVKETHLPHSRTARCDDEGRIIVADATSSGFAYLTTSATAGTWTLFGSQTCKAMTVRNRSDVAIQIRQGGAGDYNTLNDGDDLYIAGITNTNQIGATLATSGSASRLEARWEA